MFRFLLVLIFIVVPIAELAILIQVGQAIGVGWTVALLIADAVLGAMLARSQGRATWRRFNVAVQAGRPPAREVLDGVLVIFGGALLLTPGFLTDILGFLLLLPPTRAVFRAILVRRFMDRMLASMSRPQGAGHAAAWGGLRRRGHGGRAGVERDVPAGARGPGPRRSAGPLIAPEQERAQTPTGPAFADAVTFAFGDADAQLFGLARLGLSAGARQRAGRAVLGARAGGGGGARRPRGAGWRGLGVVDARRSVGDGGRAAAPVDGLARGRAARVRAVVHRARPAGRDRPRLAGRAGRRDDRLRAGLLRRGDGAGRRERGAHRAASASAVTSGASRTGAGSSPRARSRRGRRAGSASRWSPCARRSAATAAVTRPRRSGRRCSVPTG